MKKTVFITGASSGFGKAIAILFAASGHRLILCARRADRLAALAEELHLKYQTDALTLPYDVRSRSETFAKIHSLPDSFRQIDILINNAGLALGRDYFEEADLDDWETMLDTNVKGLVYTTRAVLPYLIASGQGHIINLGSIAGQEVYEKGNMYCASKHAVDALSKSMRIDLLRHGIRVSAIHPGAAETEFSLIRFKGDADLAASVYKGFQPLSAGDVAEVVHYCASLPPHVCINELVITPTAQANALYFHRT